jgi:hypothetical protein
MSSLEYHFRIGVQNEQKRQEEDKQGAPG